jgi:hypothetical protein
MNTIITFYLYNKAARQDATLQHLDSEITKILANVI